MSECIALKPCPWCERLPKHRSRQDVSYSTRWHWLECCRLFGLDLHFRTSKAEGGLTVPAREWNRWVNGELAKSRPNPPRQPQPDIVGVGQGCYQGGRLNWITIGEETAAVHVDAFDLQTGGEPTHGASYRVELRLFEVGG